MLEHIGYVMLEHNAYTVLEHNGYHVLEHNMYGVLEHNEHGVREHNGHDVLEHFGYHMLEHIKTLKTRYDVETSQQLVLSAPFSFFSPLLPFAGLELHNCQPAGTIAAPGCQSTTHLGLLLKINQ
jgi:hypothetical protein